MPSPTIETVAPAHSSRKSRCRNGASNRIRPASAWYADMAGNLPPRPPRGTRDFPGTGPRAAEGTAAGRRPAPVGGPHRRPAQPCEDGRMYAVTMPDHGGPEVLTWAEVPDPEPGEGELLIDVAASAVNRADLLQRSGFYPPPPGASSILGMECSGRVAAIGAGVTGWRPGDEACALLAGGGYAERVAVPAGQVLPVPAGVSPVDAAALPEVACTVWSNLIRIAR